MLVRAVVFFVYLVGVLLLDGCRAATVEFVPTNLSAGWQTFASSEEGFEIKHPPEWRVHLSPGVVTISNGSVNVGVRRLDEATRRDIERVNHLPKRNTPEGERVAIGNLIGYRSAGVVGFFDNVGNMEIQSVTIERGTLTYIINWSLGRGMTKAPQSMNSVCEEMVATFRFIDIKHSDHLTYSDPVTNLTFHYPYDWILNSGGTDLNLMAGSKLLIWVHFRANTTFDQFLRQQGNQVMNVEDEEEHFSHHLIGRRCRWLDAEAYILKAANGIYLVRIAPHPNFGSVPRKTVDDFLDSLKF